MHMTQMLIGRTLRLPFLHRFSHIAPWTAVVQSPWRWNFAIEFWLQTISDEVECIVTVRFRLVAVVGENAAVNFIIPEKELSFHVSKELSE